MQSRIPSLVLTALILLVFMSIGPAASALTDWWWFQAVTYEDTFLKTLAIQAAAGLGIGLLAFATVAGSTRYALGITRSGPVENPDFQDNPIGVLLSNTPPGLVAGAVGAVAAIIFGLTATGWWQQILLFTYGGSFGYEDPLMGQDAGFYVFVLPMLMTVRGAFVGMMLLTGIAAIVVYVTGGAVSVQMVDQDGQLVPSGINLKPEARRHLASIGATLLALMAIGSFLQRYAIMYDQGGLFAGPGYADVHGTLPLLLLQAIATAVAAFVLYVGMERMAPLLIVGAAATVIGFSAITSTYPGLVQRFSVLPNELTRETPQIDSHIEATRKAWDLDAVEELTLTGDSSLTLDDIENNKVTIKNVRLWDHTPLLDTFSQVQEIRTYYSFMHVDNDRYVLDGELRQIMLSPRELVATNLPEAARTWVNQKMTYTHGYGMALGPVNEVTPEGLPVLFVKDLPPKVTHEDAFRIDRPEIYFGEGTYPNDGEIYVNTANSEFDYPEGDKNKYTIYAGKGGIEMGAIGRYLFAMRFTSTELLFSSDVTNETKVLLHRNISRRVNEVAPFLAYDSDPYLVIDEGRQVWIVDAYAVSSTFPYSRDGQDTRFNYMRNSVKVTIDAYDGSMNFYRVDEKDPIAAAWDAAFPGLFKDADEMPPGIRAHMRYAQTYFRIQSQMFATYHMTEHHIFYNREDEWEVPQMQDKQMQPYFTVMKLPGEHSEEFILMLPFNPTGKPNLAAWMVARSDGDAYGGLRVYKFPKEKMVYGPSMINARIQQDASISQDMSLWNQEGSKVERGTMLVIPIEESLIYVQPMYLQADVDSIPELKRVIVAYESKIAMKHTLGEALAEIFGTRAPPARPRPLDPEGNPTDTPILSGTVAQLVQQASNQWNDANEAAGGGSWEDYGRALDELGDTLAELDRMAAMLNPPQVPEELEELEEPVTP